MSKFCPFINSYCRTDCVFCLTARLSIIGAQTCLLAKKLNAAKPDDLKAVSDFICQEIRKTRL